MLRAARTAAEAEAAEHQRKRLEAKSELVAVASALEAERRMSAALSSGLSTTVLPRLDALCDGLHNLSATLNPSAERAALAADAEAQRGGGHGGGSGDFRDAADDGDGFDDEVVMGGGADSRRRGGGGGGPSAVDGSPLSAVARALGGGGGGAGAMADSDGAIAAVVAAALRSMLEDAELTLLTATRSAVALVRVSGGLAAHHRDGGGKGSGSGALGGVSAGEGDADAGCCAWMSSLVMGAGRSGSPPEGPRVAGGGGSSSGGGPGGGRRRLPWVEQLRQLHVVAAARRSVARTLSKQQQAQAGPQGGRLASRPLGGASVGGPSGSGASGGGGGRAASSDDGSDESSSLVSAATGGR